MKFKIKTYYLIFWKELMKRVLLAIAVLAGYELKAQDSVSSFTPQGAMPFYLFDSSDNSNAVSPLYPNLHYKEDSSDVKAWYGFAKPQGAVADGCIIVEGRSGESVSFNDITGRQIFNSQLPVSCSKLASGVNIVKVGEHASKKLVASK